MPKKAVKERRKSPRIDSRLAFQVERMVRPSTERPMTTETMNLSSGGVCCSVRSFVEPLTKVSMTLLLPSFGRKGKKTQVVSCAGVVVRCAERAGNEYDLACAFTDLKREDKHLIEEYVGWRRSQNSFDERLSQP